MTEHHDRKADTPRAGWFDDMLTRREAGVRVAGVAAAVGAASLLGACKKDDKEAPAEQENDAIALQREHGWDIAANGTLSLEGVQTTDSLGGDAAAVKDPDVLVQALTSADEAMRAWESPVLLQALSQASLSQVMAPIRTPAMVEAYARGRAVGQLVASTENPQQTLLIVDLPGPEAVAAAAGMARDVNAAFFFDNWPHPDGVVHSHETLGAAMYFAREIAAARPVSDGSKPPDPRARALILDSNRLIPYTDAATQFDNRYMAILPEAAQLREMNITRVQLVVPQAASNVESDDLNDYVVAYRNAGIDVSMLPMSMFTPASDEPAELASEQVNVGGETVNNHYYGGSYAGHRSYFAHYPMFIWIPVGRYGRYYSPNPTGAAMRNPATSYNPQPRRTMFTGRTTGGTAAGVGRQRPTGFGRVTSRVDGTGRVSSVRSGSLGRVYSSSSA